MNISPTSPKKYVSLDAVKDIPTNTALSGILRILEDTQQDIAKVINNNALAKVSQATVPTVTEDTYALWLNTSGTVGESKAYIVTKQNNVTYTFGSKEVY